MMFVGIDGRLCYQNTLLSWQNNSGTVALNAGFYFGLDAGKNHLQRTPIFPRQILIIHIMEATSISFYTCRNVFQAD